MMWRVDEEWKPWKDGARQEVTNGIGMMNSTVVNLST